MVAAFGATMLPHVYAVAMPIMAIAFRILPYDDPKHRVPGHITHGRQLEALADPKVWKYCRYYSIVFGGCVALSLRMVNCHVGEVGLDIRVAALRAACFAPSAAGRATSGAHTASAGG